MIQQYPNFCRSFGCHLAGNYVLHLKYGKPYCEYIYKEAPFGCLIFNARQIFRTPIHKTKMTEADELKLLMWKNKLRIKDE